MNNEQKIALITRKTRNGGSLEERIILSSIGIRNMIIYPITPPTKEENSLVNAINNFITLLKNQISEEIFYLAIEEFFNFIDVMKKLKIACILEKNILEITQELKELDFSNYNLIISYLYFLQFLNKDGKCFMPDIEDNKDFKYLHLDKSRILKRFITVQTFVQRFMDKKILKVRLIRELDLQSKFFSDFRKELESVADPFDMIFYILSMDLRHIKKYY